MTTYPLHAGPGSPAPSSVPCTCFPHQQQQAMPAAPFTPSTLWLPLHEAQERWARFGKDATTTRALIATGHAFLALSWEQSALRHYQQAMQQQHFGFQRAMLCTLEEVLRNLDAAIHHWQPCYSQLERLIHQRALYEEEQTREDLRDLLIEIACFQRRLGALYDQINEEREGSSTLAHQQQPQPEREVAP